MDDSCAEANVLHFFCINRELAWPHEGILVPGEEFRSIVLSSELPEH